MTRLIRLTESTAQSTFNSFSSVNSYSILSEEHATPSKSRSPSPTRATSSMTHKSNLKVLNINCQSIANKKAEFQAIIDEHKPDIVVGTESWLTKNHLSSEIFPKSLGYTSFRQDRVADTCGGGVFILVEIHLLLLSRNSSKQIVNLSGSR